MILGCLFLSSQLEKTADKLLRLSSKIFKTNFLNHSENSSNKSNCSKLKNSFYNNQYVNNKIEKIIKNYNIIITNQDQMNQHTWKTFLHLNELFVFIVLFPSLVLFDRNRNLFYIVFYSTNYIFIIILFYLIVYFNSIYLNSVSLQ